MTHRSQRFSQCKRDNPFYAKWLLCRIWIWLHKYTSGKLPNQLKLFRVEDFRKIYIQRIMLSQIFNTQSVHNFQSICQDIYLFVKFRFCNVAFIRNAIDSKCSWLSYSWCSSNSFPSLGTILFRYQLSFTHFIRKMIVVRIKIFDTQCTKNCACVRWLRSQCGVHNMTLLDCCQ